ncbi:hypothetical protein C8R46DRAFT_1218223 [Mycena filopes]|nr:hypothetical protein C8R46DRAFT_1218223 [Mycena filopes]
MPKTPRTPVRPRPKPKSPASRSKKVTSSPFVDDEAEDSEDGVLVEAADAAGHQLPDDEPDNVARADYDDEYEQDFINDGDPFEDTVRRYPTLFVFIIIIIISAHAACTLHHYYAGLLFLRPPSPLEASALDSGPLTLQKSLSRLPLPEFIEAGPPLVLLLRLPVLSNGSLYRLLGQAFQKVLPSASAGGDVIEVDDTSDEDLAAMDVDDSVFRKPAGVKASALPPSLLTRSAAAKKGIQPPALTVTGRVKTDEDAPDPASPAQDPPAIVDGCNECCYDCPSQWVVGAADSQFPAVWFTRSATSS